MAIVGNSPLFFPTLLVLSVVVVVLVYVLYRFRQRQAAARRHAETTQSEEDRAFNQIRFLRDTVERLERQGAEVTALREELGRAEAAERRGDPSAALLHTAAARSRFGAGRSDPNPPRARPSNGASEPPTGPAGPEGDDSGGGSVPPPGPRLPAHQAEARFALNLLAGEMARAAGDPGAEERRAAARAELDEGLRAYARGDYATAWKLGLKGRRTVGGKVEGVASPEGALPDPPVEGADGPVAPRPTGGGPVPLEATELQPCGQCGRPTSASDRFCRGCGAPSGAIPCPRCRAPLTPDDRFCGRCGNPQYE